MCFNSINCVLNIGKKGIANHWATFVLRTVIRTGTHTIVTLTLLEIYFRIPLLRLLLRGSFAFATITCFILEKLDYFIFELSLYESAFLSAFTKWNSRTDTASALVAFSFSFTSNPRLFVTRNLTTSPSI